MATEKLLRAFITGPEEKLDEAIGSLILGRQFHPTHAATVLKFLGKLKVPDGTNPYRPHLDSAVSLLAKLGIEPAFREFESKGYVLEKTAAYIKGVSGTCSRLITHKNAEESLAGDNRELLSRLMPFSELHVDLSDLLGVRWQELHFGSISKSKFGILATAAERDDDGIFLFRTGAVEDRVYCVYLTIPDCADNIAELFEFLGFQFEDTPEGAGLTGIPAEKILALEDEAKKAEINAAAFKSELHALAKAEQEELLSHYSWLLYKSRVFDLRSNTAVKYGKFHITGWLPENEGNAFRESAEALGMDCFLEKPGLADIGRIPVKLTTGFFTRIFAPLMEMYGYPAYGEVDPRIFMALSYTLLFGIMFGDVGQGAVLVLTGIFLAMKKGSWLGRVLACVGCSSILFGFIYGSVFGNEHWLPGFKVLEGDNVMEILIITVGIGILLMIICLVMNIVTGIRQHDPKRAFFSANGVAGGALFISVIAAIAAELVLGFDLFSPVYIIFLIALPALCLFCAEPLSKLCLGSKDWKPESWAMFFIEGFFDIFEMALSYFSNCVSFLRVGAYAICHAGMMMVVYMLSTGSDGGTAIWGVVLGNILVMVIEAVLVFIQVLRLEFYELSGKYYSGLGLPFSPASINYAAAGANE